MQFVLLFHLKEVFYVLELETSLKLFELTDGTGKDM